MVMEQAYKFNNTALDTKLYEKRKLYEFFIFIRFSVNIPDDLFIASSLSSKLRPVSVNSFESIFFFSLSEFSQSKLIPHTNDNNDEFSKFLI